MHPGEDRKVAGVGGCDQCDAGGGVYSRMLSHNEITDLALPVLQLAIDAGEAILQVYDAKDLQIERKADDSPLTLADRRAHDVIDAGLISLASNVPVLSEEGREIPFLERKHWNELWLVDPLDGTREFIKGNGEFTVNIGLVQNGLPVFGVVYGPVCGTAYVGITPRRDPISPDGTRFPNPGAYRFLLGDGGPGGTPALANLARRAEPILGKAPGNDRINIIASRPFMGRRTRAFVKTVGAGYEDVKLLHVGSSLKLCLIAEGSASIYPRNAPTMEWDTAAGHAVVKAAGGEIYQAPRDGHAPFPDWLAGDPVDTTSPNGIGRAARIEPLRYNKENLVNPRFVARGW